MSKDAGSKTKSYTLRYLIFGFGISLIITALTLWDQYESLELRTLDQRFLLRGTIPQDPNIGTVDIDDETHEAEGRFADWTRDKHEHLVDILSEFEVRMLGFDIFFPEPSARIITREYVANLTDFDTNSILDIFPDYDAQLADAAKRAGNVYFSYFFEKPSNEDTGWDYVVNNTVRRTGLKEESYQLLLKHGYYLDIPEDKRDDFSKFFLGIDLAPPIPEFIPAVKGVGFVQPKVDIDGVIRWYELFRIYDQKLFPALALIMLCDYLHVPFKSLEVIPGEHVKLPQARYPDGTVKDLYIPIDKEGKMLVNWAGRYQDTFVHFPYERIIQLKGLYAEAVALRDVKRLVHKNPEYLQDPDLFIEAAEKYEITPPEAAMTAYQTVQLFSFFEQVLQEDLSITAVDFFTAQGIPEEEIPEDLSEKFTELKYNLQMAQLMTENPEITLEEIAERIGVRRLFVIEHGYYALKNLVEHGGIKPEHHPLIFFSIFHQGKELLPSDLKDKVLVYGLTATGTQDLNPTPFQPRYQMVGYHPNAFNTMLTEQFLTRMELPYRIAFLIVLGGLMGLLVPFFGPISGAGFVLGILSAQVVSAYLLFVYSGLWMDIVAPFSVIVFSYLSISVNNYIIERRERSYIQNSFKMYLSPAVVDQIANNPDLLSLGGRRVTLTILFTDVAGFSTISEQMTAEGLVELLNEYLGEMTNIIMEHNGTVDKYEGDLIMAFWGAPIDSPNHAVDACYASLAMRKKLAEQRANWRAQGRPDYIANMDARIGLNTGEVVVGNMGSDLRMDYTVMGDHVNLASRLEGANKPYGTNLMISQFTYALVKDTVEVRELDKIRVVGRDESVTVYEVLSKKNELDPDKAKVISAYNEALGIYKERKWDEALEAFLNVLNIDPKDGPSKTYVDRCERYKIEPPPDDWDGVETMKEK